MYSKKFLVKGIVQGVGFRPYCVRLAISCSLTGVVRNTSSGVEIIVEGELFAIDKFVDELKSNPPSASVITRFDCQWEKEIDSPTFSVFSIENSVREEKQQVFIPSDLAVCPECLAEMRDKHNRRYRYPFINCTLCGPRYSIISSLPYDRPQTTMRNFRMCPECQREYDTPSDRRFHAQPNACPVCGPHVALVKPLSGERLAHGDEALRLMSTMLSDGKIVAIKGIGGFHIACLPDELVLKQLRKRKKRPDKPFALMFSNITSARKTVEISTITEKLLMGTQHPIVLCRGEPMPLVAPGQSSVGVMLPYTPLHHLLMDDFDCLVMTSANMSEAPIIYRNDDAVTQLADIVDAVLIHNRGIDMAIDDSVIKLFGKDNNRIFLRRARGYTPEPMPRVNYANNVEPACVFAAGADIKSSFAIAQDDVIFPGQYLGDLRDMRTADYYRRAAEHFLKLYSLKPRVLVHDMHPDYYSTRLALKLCPSIEREYAIQHHMAHFAAVLAESMFTSSAIGVIFDGSGYGTDGTVWGGEFFTGSLKGMNRVASLLPFKLPGGDKAVLEPWRIAVSLLCSTVGPEEALKVCNAYWTAHPEILAKVPVVMQSIKSCVTTTSCGRLFDGISALLGLCLSVSYEGQAAMMLESVATEISDSRCIKFGQINGDFCYLDWRPVVLDIIYALSDGKSIQSISSAFHVGLAKAVVDICCVLRKTYHVNNVALSGGVWQNAVLLESALNILKESNFNIITHNKLSPNDENISVGQLVLASSRVL